MGFLDKLFGGKTVTTVGTVTSRVIEDNLLSTSVQTGVIRGVLQNGGIAENILEGLVSSIGLKADRMYNYAENNYTHGLPRSKFFNSNQGTDVVSAVLSTLEGSPITINYINLGPANTLHLGWMELIRLHSYNSTTNQLETLSAAKGVPVFLVDMIVVIPTSMVNDLNSKVLAQWGTPPRAATGNVRKILDPGIDRTMKHTPVRVDPAAVNDYVEVTYSWETSVTSPTGIVTKTLHTEVINLDISNFDPNANFYHCSYDLLGVTKYWIYEIGVGTYPTIDAIYNDVMTDPGTFFPFTYFRFNKQSQITNKTSDSFKTSKKMLKYLKMDYETVAENMDQNPDIANVEQAMMMMAVPANSGNEVEAKYLFDFFKTVYNNHPIQKPYQAIIDTGNKFTDFAAAFRAEYEALSSTMVISDNRFQLSLSYDGVYKKKKVGVIGKIGDSKVELKLGSTSQEFTDPSGDVFTENFPRTTHLYKRQLTETIYEEIQVVGLKSTYYILDQHHATADEDDDILLIPINRAISNMYSLPVKEELYGRSLHYIFNSVVITKIKWYQTGLFKYLMIIVAVVITIVTAGAGFSTIIAAIAAGEIALAALLILEIVLTQLLIAYAFKLFVKLVGIKIAFIVAIVAAIAGVYQAIDAGSIAGAPWASELLSLASGISTAGSAFISDAMEGLIEEYSAFEKEVKEQTKLLDSAKELLDNKIHLSPFIIFGETPSEFYDRTTHAGNIGIVAIEAIENYVEMSLRLPKFSETYNGFQEDSA